MSKRAFTFTKATKEALKGRVALVGPSGSGKTFSALAIAEGLAGDCGRVAVIDTENRSARKYSDVFAFDVLELDHFAPQTYVDAIHAAEDAGFDVLVIDSLSHAWMGKGGALEQVDQKAKGGNTFAAWRHVTPQHNALVDALVRCKCHLIVTMRSRTEYVIEQNDRGKAVPRRVGLAPVQREGIDYEFDVVGELDLDHTMTVTKSRCFDLSGAVVQKPGVELGHQLLLWLDDGARPLEDLVRDAGTAAAARLVDAGLDEDDAKARIWQEAGRVAKAAGASQRLPSHIRQAADNIVRQLHAEPEADVAARRDAAIAALVESHGIDEASARSQIIDAMQQARAERLKRNMGGPDYLAEDVKQAVDAVVGALTEAHDGPTADRGVELVTALRKGYGLDEQTADQCVDMAARETVGDGYRPGQPLSDEQWDEAARVAHGYAAKQAPKRKSPRQQPQQATA